MISVQGMHFIIKLKLFHQKVQFYTHTTFVTNVRYLKSHVDAVYEIKNTAVVFCNVDLQYCYRYYVACQTRISCAECSTVRLCFRRVRF